MRANAHIIDASNEADIEQLELYLDHELADGEVRRLDERLTGDAALRESLEALRGQRTNRLAAMSTAFDTDAASIERLIASVRVAQASEAIQRRRWWAMGPQMKSVFATAACVAFGLLLGVTLQNRHAGSSGVVASPASVNTSAWGISSDAALGPSVVSVTGADGRELMKVHFTDQEQARQFMNQLNSRSGTAPLLNVGDAKMSGESY